MPYSPARKKTLLIPSGPAHDPDRKHFFVTLNDACKDGLHLLVSISSIKVDMHYDPTCVIAGGGADHEFIKEQSFVAYSRGETYYSAHIQKMVDGWYYAAKANVSDNLFDRICAGLEASDETKQRIINYYKAL